MKYLFLT
jgi:serine/threonine protein kinase